MTQGLRLSRLGRLLVRLVATLLGRPASAQPAPFDRTVLPIPEPAVPTITTLDARDAKAPPRFQVTAPKGAPNVVIVLLDDIGFGQSSAFGGPIKMATLDSVMTYQDIASYIQARHPDKLLITGEDRFLGYSLRRGAKAALIGMGAVCADLQAELIEAHFTGKADRFLELSDLIDRLAEVFFIKPMEGYIGRILYALARLGVIPADAANDPWGPALTAPELDNINTLLNTLNVQVG